MVQDHMPDSVGAFTSYGTPIYCHVSLSSGGIMAETRLRYTVLMEQNEDGGYTVTVPSLPFPGASARDRSRKKHWHILKRQSRGTSR